jgi:hypothetical protein
MTDKWTLRVAEMRDTTTQMRSSQLDLADHRSKLMSSYDEQEMEAGDVGEEEGMNDGEVEENMIVASPSLMFNIPSTDKVGIKSSRRRRETYRKSSKAK